MTTIYISDRAGTETGIPYRPTTPPAFLLALCCNSASLADGPITLGVILLERTAPTKLALSLPFFLSCWRRTRLSQRAWVLIMGCIPALRASADCGRAARRPSNPRRRCFTSGAHTSFQAKIFGFGNQSLARRRVRCDGAPQLPLGFAPPREPLPGRRKQTLCGPGRKSQALHAQDTRRVYEGLLGCAERSIWASTYAFFDGPRAFEVLARRMETRPSLSVTLLLNIQRKRNDTSASDQLVQRFADRFWKTDWPGSVHPSVFYDPRSLDPEGAGGVLHAKAVVADDEAVFVTSANLTEAGSVTSESHSRSVGCTSIERPVATSIHRPSLLRRQGNSSAWKPS